MACLLPVETIEGARIDTIEGLTPAEGLHPIQEAFLEGFATQCGFCTSGMIMATAGLLAANPEPTREDVVRAISGNVCRCTGYEAIIDAVLDAAERLRAAEHQRRRWRDGTDRHRLLRRRARRRPLRRRHQRPARRRPRPRHRPHPVLRGRELPRHAAPRHGALDPAPRADHPRHRPGAGGPGRGARPDPQGRAEQLVHDPQADRRRPERRAGAARGPRPLHGRADLRRARRDPRRRARRRPPRRASTTRTCPRSSTSRRR